MTININSSNNHNSNNDNDFYTNIKRLERNNVKGSIKTQKKLVRQLSNNIKNLKIKYNNSSHKLTQYTDSKINVDNKLLGNKTDSSRLLVVNRRSIPLVQYLNHNLYAVRTPWRYISREDTLRNNIDELLNFFKLFQKLYDYSYYSNNILSSKRKQFTKPRSFLSCKGDTTVEDLESLEYEYLVKFHDNVYSKISVLFPILSPRPGDENTTSVTSDPNRNISTNLNHFGNSSFSTGSTSGSSYTSTTSSVNNQNVLCCDNKCYVIKTFGDKLLKHQKYVVIDLCSECTTSSYNDGKLKYDFLNEFNKQIVEIKLNRYFLPSLSNIFKVVSIVLFWTKFDFNFVVINYNRINFNVLLLFSCVILLFNSDFSNSLTADFEVTNESLTETLSMLENKLLNTLKWREYCDTSFEQYQFEQTQEKVGTVNKKFEEQQKKMDTYQQGVGRKEKLNNITEMYWIYKWPPSYKRYLLYYIYINNKILKDNEEYLLKELKKYKEQELIHPGREMDTSDEEKMNYVYDKKDVVNVLERKYYELNSITLYNCLMPNYSIDIEVYQMGKDNDLYNYDDPDYVNSILNSNFNDEVDTDDEIEGLSKGYDQGNYFKYLLKNNSKETNIEENDDNLIYKEYYKYGFGEKEQSEDNMLNLDCLNYQGVTFSNCKCMNNYNYKLLMLNKERIYNNRDLNNRDENNPNNNTELNNESFREKLLEQQQYLVKQKKLKEREIIGMKNEEINDVNHEQRDSVGEDALLVLCPHNYVKQTVLGNENKKQSQPSSPFNFDRCKKQINSNYIDKVVYDYSAKNNNKLDKSNLDVENNLDRKNINCYKKNVVYDDVCVVFVLRVNKVDRKVICSYSFNTSMLDNTVVNNYSNSGFKINGCGVKYTSGKSNRNENDTNNNDNTSNRNVELVLGIDDLDMWYKNQFLEDSYFVINLTQVDFSKRKEYNEKEEEEKKDGNEEYKEQEMKEKEYYKYYRNGSVYNFINNHVKWVDMIDVYNLYKLTNHNIETIVLSLKICNTFSESLNLLINLNKPYHSNYYNNNVANYYYYNKGNDEGLPLGIEVDKINTSRSNKDKDKERNESLLKLENDGENNLFGVKEKEAVVQKGLEMPLFPKEYVGTVDNKLFVEEQQPIEQKVDENKDKIYIDKDLLLKLKQSNVMVSEKFNENLSELDNENLVKLLSYSNLSLNVEGVKEREQIKRDEEHDILQINVGMNVEKLGKDEIDNESNVEKELLLLLKNYDEIERQKLIENIKKNQLLYLNNLNLQKIIKEEKEELVDDAGKEVDKEQQNLVFIEEKHLLGEEEQKLSNQQHKLFVEEQQQELLVKQKLYTSYKEDEKTDVGSSDSNLIKEEVKDKKLVDYEVLLGMGKDNQEDSDIVVSDESRELSDSEKKEVLLTTELNIKTPGSSTFDLLLLEKQNKIEENKKHEEYREYKKDKDDSENNERKESLLKLENEYGNNKEKLFKEEQVKVIPAELEVPEVREKDKNNIIEIHKIKKQEQIPLVKKGGDGLRMKKGGKAPPPPKGPIKSVKRVLPLGIKLHWKPLLPNKLNNTIFQLNDGSTIKILNNIFTQPSNINRNEGKKEKENIKLKNNNGSLSSRSEGSQNNNDLINVITIKKLFSRSSIGSSSNLSSLGSSVNIDQNKTKESINSDGEKDNVGIKKIKSTASLIDMNKITLLDNKRAQNVSIILRYNNLNEYMEVLNKINRLEYIKINRVNNKNNENKEVDVEENLDNKEIFNGCRDEVQILDETNLVEVVDKLNIIYPNSNEEELLLNNYKYQLSNYDENNDNNNKEEEDDMDIKEKVDDEDKNISNSLCVDETYNVKILEKYRYIERILLELLLRKNMYGKIKMIKLMVDINNSIQVINEQLETYSKAVNEIKSNVILPILLNIILKYGNYINYGNIDQGDSGFTLSSTVKLMDFKSFDNNISSLHYLILNLYIKLFLVSNPDEDKNKSNTTTMEIEYNGEDKSKGDNIENNNDVEENLDKKLLNIDVELKNVLLAEKISSKGITENLNELSTELFDIISYFNITPSGSAINTGRSNKDVDINKKINKVINIYKLKLNGVNEYRKNVFENVIGIWLYLGEDVNSGNIGNMSNNKTDKSNKDDSENNLDLERIFAILSELIKCIKKIFNDIKSKPVKYLILLNNDSYKDIFLKLFMDNKALTNYYKTNKDKSPTNNMEINNKK